MDLYEELRMQEKERIVDSLATENQMLQEPKTPTKEQIDNLLQVIRKDDNVATYSTILGLMDLGYDDEEVIEKIITEWEKIRNSPN